MEQDGTEVFIIDIDDIRELLIAPPRDIFSDRPHVYMGQSVVDRLLEHFMHQFELKSQKHRMVLRMPSEKITPDLSARCEEALDRYTSTKIHDNDCRKRAVRRRGLLEIPVALLFLIASVTFGFLIGSQVITGLPSWGPLVLKEGFFIFGWVAMWGPVDTLLFGTLELSGENRALRALERTAVVIQPRD